MKTSRFCALFLLPIILVFAEGRLHPAVAGGEDSPIEFFPRERLFPKFLADGTAQQFSLNKDAQTRRWIGSIGGSQRLAEWKPGNLRIQAGVGATVYASLVRQPSVLQVVTADFFVDFPLEIQFSHVCPRTAEMRHVCPRTAEMRYDEA